MNLKVLLKDWQVLNLVSLLSFGIKLPIVPPPVIHSSHGCNVHTFIWLNLTRKARVNDLQSWKASGFLQTYLWWSSSVVFVLAKLPLCSWDRHASRWQGFMLVELPTLPHIAVSESLVLSHCSLLCCHTLKNTGRTEITSTFVPGSLSKQFRELYLLNLLTQIKSVSSSRYHTGYTQHWQEAGVYFLDAITQDLPFLSAPDKLPLACIAEKLLLHKEI